MINKEMIKKLRDNAKLAWATYGYYDLVGNLNLKTKKFKFKIFHIL